MDETTDRMRSVAVTSRAETGTGERHQPGLELLIGSNIFRNTNGIVKIQGKEQLVLECKPEQELLLTADLYDERGARIGHLRRNVLAVNQGGQFVVEIHQGQDDPGSAPPAVRLFNQQSGEIILDVQVLSDRKIQISSGKLFSHRGSLVEITPHYCRIGSGMTRFGDIVENRGGMVLLG